MKDLKYENRYKKIQFFEFFVANIITDLKKAAPRFELGIKDLQSSALPLGHAADRDMIESHNDPTSNASHSLLIICNGHGEDVIALEIIKRFLKKIKIKKGGTQIRTGDKGFAILCLTTWPCRRKRFD